MPHDCLTTALFGIASDLSCLACLATSHLFSKNPNFEETTTHPLGSRLGHVDKMNSEELGQIEIVPRYVVNENRYFQCEGWPTEDSPDDDSEKPDDHIGDSLCDQYGITADTYSLCALCRSTFSEKLYSTSIFLALKDGSNTIDGLKYWFARARAADFANISSMLRRVIAGMAIRQRLIYLSS
jgi:hypothetical protein